MTKSIIPRDDKVYSIFEEIAKDLEVLQNSVPDKNEFTYKKVICLNPDKFDALYVIMSGGEPLGTPVDSEEVAKGIISWVNSIEYKDLL